MDSGWKPGQGRRRGGKAASLDDALGDLLGSDTDEPKKKTGGMKRNEAVPNFQAKAYAKSLKGKGGKSRGGDEDFYGNLAADISGPSDESEVSEANLDELNKTLGDLDDMESSLFSSPKKKKLPAKSPVKAAAPKAPKTPSPKASPATPRKKTTAMEEHKKGKSPRAGGKDSLDDLLAEKPVTTKAAESTPAKSKPKTIDFGDFDEDDPLAGLLSDDEDEGSRKKRPGKKKRQQKPAAESKTEEVTKTEGKNESWDTDEETEPASKPALVRPPTRSGSRPTSSEPKPDPSVEEVAPKLGVTPRKGSANAQKKRDEINFDDDDDSGDLLGGLSSPRKQKETSKEATPTKKTTTANKKKDEIDFDDDDLLGGLDSPRKPKETKAKEKTSILDSLLGKSSVDEHLKRPGSGERTFTFDKTKLPPKKEEKPKQKDEEEEDFTFGDYMPSAASTGRPSSTLRRSVRFQDDEDMFGLSSSKGRSGIPATLQLDEGTDWLDMASGTKTDQSGAKKTTESNKQSKAKQDSGSDWLGLSASKSDDENDWLGLSTAKSKTSKAKSSTDKHLEERENVTQKERTVSPDDWLGLGSSKTKQTEKKSELGHTAQSTASGRGQSPTRSESKEQSDWLGLGSPKHNRSFQEEDPSDWLSGPKKTPTQQDGKKDTADDYLGLGKEVSANDSRGSQLSSADERGLDLFSSPSPRRTSTLPWESAAKAGRRATQNVPSQQQSPRQQPQQPKQTVADSSSPAQRIQAETSLTAQVQDSIMTPKLGEPPVAELPVDVSVPKTGLAQQIEQLQKLQQQQQQEEQRLQEEKLKQQQQSMLQMQLQQAEIQKQIQQQQEQQLLAQQKELMDQQLREHQLKMERMQQQLATSQLTPPSMMHVPGSPYTLSPTIAMMGTLQDPQSLAKQRAELETTVAELETRLKKLELEKEHLQSTIESTKNLHQEEMKTVESIHKGRVQMIEESYQRREARLKEDVDLAAAQNALKIKQMEMERADLMSSQQRKIQELERERTEELQRLKEQHRSAITDIQKEHEEAIQRLRAINQQEVEAVSTATSHNRSLQSVVDRIQSNTRSLSDLQHVVETHHFANINDRDIAATARDEHLKLLQERLIKQQGDMDKERERLQQLVAKMEIQLREQGRQLEEEKWKVKQEQNKLSVLQISVEEERRMITDQLTRERSELQSSKDALLKEQKTIYSQLYDERRALSEERAQFNMLQSTLLNREQRDTVRNVQAEADLEGTMKTLSNEKMRLQTMSEELQKEQQRINTEKLAVDQQKAALQMEKEKLDELATHMKLRSQEVEEISLEASKVREEGDRMLAEARKVQAEQSNKLQNIQIQISALREKERQIAQERLGLAKEKKELGQLRNSFICVNCRTPVKDATQQGSPILGTALNIPGSSANANGAAISFQGSGTGEPFTSPVLNSISSSLAKDRTFRMWKMNAEKDHEFLEDESLFLEALKHSPYHTPPTAVKD